jgi:predicted nicotinamide N-methyase
MNCSPISPNDVLANASVEERVTIAGAEWVIHRPPSAEDLIDEDAYARDERLPYWADLWPSAHVLAEYVARRGVADTRMVELGCGLGLPSIVAAGHGADVLATDWYSDALEFVSANAKSANVELRTGLLDWFNPNEVVLSHAPYDLVVGADLLYEDRNGEALLGLLPRLVAADGEVVISDPRRPNAASLLHPIAALGWSVETTEHEHGGRIDESGPRVHLHRLRPPA